jgi:hypothetical protein
VVAASQSATTAAAGQTVMLEVQATDPEGAALSFSWIASAGTLATPSSADGTSAVTWTAPSPFDAPARIDVAVTDATGATTVQSYDVGFDAAPAPTPPVYLSDLTWQTANGLSVRKDLSHNGGPIVLDGVTYPKGLSTHPTSCCYAYVRYALDGSCADFGATIGIDDFTGGAGSVDFKVVLDGVEVFDSGVVLGSDSARPIAIPLGAASELELRAYPTGGGSPQDADWDWATWADARLMGCSP